MPEHLEARIGPFAFTFESDGDDPGTGIVVLETDSGYRGATEVGVARREWDKFIAAGLAVLRWAP
jgi:hypothetical protein